METLDACVGWIVSLVEAADPGAARKALAEADAYLASFSDPGGTGSRRADLLADLHERLPRTALAQDVIKAISRGAVDT
jgi:hypothetical protein